MSPKPSKVRRALVTGAIVAGAGLGAAGIASAATTSTSSSTGSSATTAPPAASAPAPPSGSAGTPPANVDPATMTHGPNETLLTGTDLQKATAAATAAEPGATIVRAETDSSGAATYEVHMQKSDGTYITVQLNSGFVVTGTVSGFGPGPAGSQPPSASSPNSSSSSSSTTN